MDISLKKSKIAKFSSVRISGSKSETNRLLLLQALFPEIKLENTSDSDDSRAMAEALQSDSPIIDIGHAGTAMRFLTAYFASQPGRIVTLTGSPRMLQRPIKILVDALRTLGAEIDYLGLEGFPPLKITGTKFSGDSVSLNADVSSQYITALLLIAPRLERGLELTLTKNTTSRPYIEMTLALLNQIGITTHFDGRIIKVCAPGDCLPGSKRLVVESDWSSASYFYSIVALSEIGTSIALSTFRPDSFQGDRALAAIYKLFGVDTRYEDSAIVLRKTTTPSSAIALNLQDTPDIAQTIAVTAFASGISAHITGLQTLKIKETDRLAALQAELIKLGAEVKVTSDSLTLAPSAGIRPNVLIDTYDDHRMAMSFAPLALRVPIRIANAGVVSKSYPRFWDDLESIGFQIAKR